MFTYYFKVPKNAHIALLRSNSPIEECNFMLISYYYYYF